MKSKKRITIHPKMCFGKPCIRGMRFPVVFVLDLLNSEMTNEEILEDHPQLELEDLDACLQFAQLQIQGKTMEEIMKIINE